MTDAELDDLRTRGWFLREGFGPAADAARVVRHRAAGFVPAGLSQNHGVDLRFRRDATAWLAEDDPQLAPLWAGFEALRVELNVDAWQALLRFDVQLARFGGDGAYYVRHRDATRGQGGRRVTAIAWLNPGWLPADGGELLLHVEPPVRVAPELGRMIVFLSEQIEHEVLATWAPRFAATAWFYAR